MSDGKKQYPDFLVRQRLFPDAGDIFSFAPASLPTALKEGLVVVDTNVLLVPYTTGQASLEQIRRTYERLVADGRLRIPGQVAREFADNRAEKLKTLFSQLSRKRDTAISKSEYPLLEGLSSYSEVLQREAALVEALGNYRKAIGVLLDTVTAWNWDDPVSAIYRQFFSREIVIDPELDRGELTEELKYRQEHRIPPGFKDAGNEYCGVGDLLIWKTILELGKQHSRHLIFVSGDEKTDWRYQSENRALYPRFELLDEYRRASEGKSFFIISFAELLEQLGAPAPVVQEVRQEETAAQLTNQAHRPKSRLAAVEGAVVRWLFTQYPGATAIAQRGGFPDVVVSRGDREDGFEIKFIRQLSSFVRVLSELPFYSSHHNAPQMRISLVLVAEDSRVIEQIRVYLNHRLTVSGVAQIIVGYLTPEGVFEERFRCVMDDDLFDAI